MDKVSIIVITYLYQNKHYLDLCMRSIANLEYDKDKLDVIIVSQVSYLPEYENARTVCPHEGQFYPAEAINYGVKVSDPTSKFFLILNDDVILTRNSLRNLVDAVGDKNAIANGISPCDQGLAYNLMFGFVDKNGHFAQMQGRAYKYDDLKDDFDELMMAESVYPPGLVRQPFLCIYATLIPRTVFEIVGTWDEKFKTGQDDLDFSLRCHQKGIDTVSILNALIWHFGGVSVESTLNMDIRIENIKYFKSKWNFLPPGIPQSFIEGK